MRLNKTQKYAIQYLLDNKKNSNEIVKELGLDKADVERYIEKHNKVSDGTTPINTTSSRVTSKDLMIRHTRDKRTNNVSIMTKEAAEYHDEFKKKTPIRNDESKGIYRPRKQ